MELALGCRLKSKMRMTDRQTDRNARPRPRTTKVVVWRTDTELAPTLQASTVRKSSDAPCTCHLLNYSLDRYRKRNNATVVAASPRPLWRWAEAHLKVSQGALRSLPVCTSGVASTGRAWLRSRPLGWFKTAHGVDGSAPVAHLASLKAQGVPTHPPAPHTCIASIRPRAVFEAIERETVIAYHSEAGHYMERLMAAAYGPLPHSSSRQAPTLRRRRT